MKNKRIFCKLIKATKFSLKYSYFAHPSNIFAKDTETFISLTNKLQSCSERAFREGP